MWHNTPMNEKPWSFECKDCGSTELYVEHEYSITEAIIDFLECSCEEGSDLAAQRTRYVTATYVDRMALDDEHYLVHVDSIEELHRLMTQLPMFPFGENELIPLISYEDALDNVKPILASLAASKK